ncbi:fibronectin type III domain-containing protein, partial [Sediminicola luteus]
MILKILYKFLTIVGYEKHLKTLLFVGSLLVFGFSGYGQAPSVPTNLTASAITATSFTLTWDASSDLGGGPITNYEIFQDGISIGTTGGATTTFNVTGLSPNTTYSYTVTATDGTNTSAQSVALDVTTTGDVTPPSAPTGLAA